MKHRHTRDTQPQAFRVLASNIYTSGTTLPSFHQRKLWKRRDRQTKKKQRSFSSRVDHGIFQGFLCNNLFISAEEEKRKKGAFTSWWFSDTKLLPWPLQTVLRCGWFPNLLTALFLHRSDQWNRKKKQMKKKKKMMMMMKLFFFFFFCLCWDRFSAMNWRSRNVFGDGRRCNGELLTP